ncbi:alpha-ketoglutarate-dependent dioxygenase AlkB [Flavobacterium sp. NST-5]|uniref:Alpha-ketoglutarate-dependent dioxygenase AlkB n=1 Tax=Flavobacterium ichthyis TaxID=2698827 RepID=A0ABW9ZAI1_9FLAO|nr:alpha-ketoglutarate-dependent dioxygenase AlkB [Flavobacterium ichthyis]NBL65709.1 alpha-ketoglutarate-dependent dioxygenase AlkB [Flavobacterium ichthyis]
MLLFSDTELFTAGKKKLHNFDFPELNLYQQDGFVTKNMADYYYHHFLNNTPWQEHKMEMYKKTIVVPRKIAWYENEKENKFTPELLTLKHQVEEKTGFEYNAVLLNLYRDGNDGVSWHSDKEDKSGEKPAIASVSFGQTRLFRLRHKFRKEVPQLEIPLHHGTLLLMHGYTNENWEHEIPKSKKPMLPRINLTFRQIK